ncbi:MAG: efflux RND transporter periplasmic adaptor subunit [Planctomycetota bacterium]
MTRQLIPSLLLVVMLSTISCSSREEGDSTEASAAAPTVEVALPLVRDRMTWLPFTGRLEPSESVNVQARVSGQLQTVHFEDGAVVEKGQLLFVIDPKPFEVLVASAEAAWNQALAQVSRAEALHKQSNASIRQAEAAKELAESRLENACKAVASNSIAQEQFDIRRSELAQAAAALEAANANSASLAAEIVTANSAVALAEAGLEARKLDLEYTRVKSPISGRLSRRLVTPGNMIRGGSSGGTILTTVVRVDPIHVYVQASERDVVTYMETTTLADRQSAEASRRPIYLALMGQQGYPFVGQFDFSDNRLDVETGTMSARGVFDNKDLRLVPGLFARVQISCGSAHPTLLIPDKAIGSDQSLRFVMVVRENNTVARANVVTGGLVDGLRVVQSGLSKSDRVVISGLPRAIPGNTVTPTLVDFASLIIDDGVPDVVQPIPETDWIRIPNESPSTEQEEQR